MYGNNERGLVKRDRKSTVLFGFGNQQSFIGMKQAAFFREVKICGKIMPRADVA